MDATLPHLLQQFGRYRPAGAMHSVREVPLHPLLESGVLGHPVPLMPFFSALGHRATRSGLLDAIVTASVTNPTTVTELSGIRIAAISGVSWPLTANDTPVML